MFTHQFVPKFDLPRVTHEDGVRYYVSPSGEHLESVTTYLGRLMDKDFLKKWKKKVGEAEADRISNSATARGSKLHSAVEAYLLNDDSYKTLLSDHKLTKALFLKVKPTLDRMNNIRLLESPLYSDEMKLAGTPDCIAEYDGVLSTIDFKTSTRDKKDEWITGYKLQAAIYSKMFLERTGILPDQSIILIGVENSPVAQVYIESTYDSQLRLEEFLDDPILFQKKKI